MNLDRLSTEVLVIGSGAGGALTAATLAEAGKRVLLIEDGPWLDPGAVTPYSVEEMTSKYRYGGLNSTVGLPPIAFVEGRCVGGGTEINSGLYHRLPEDAAEEWSRRWKIADFSPDLLQRYALSVEESLSISLARGPVPAASLALEKGAKGIGLRATEVPRAFRASANGGNAVKQTMTRTFIPRAEAAGAGIMAGCSARRLRHQRGRVSGTLCRREVEPGVFTDLEVLADQVFVCGGATATPLLLRRSGIRRNIGDRMKLHPMIKMAARFDEPLDDHSVVPMHQVRDLDRSISYGCSVSRPGYIALALGENWEANARDIDQWQNMAVYYACILTEAHGTLRSVPGLGWQVLAYQLTESDMSRLARSLVGLGELLFAAGASKLYPGIVGAEPMSHPKDLADIWSQVGRSRVTVTSVHLFCGVKMGEDRESTGADSYGRVWGFENLFVNDASLLCDAPGVNPQGSIMAIAARNCDHFLASS